MSDRKLVFSFYGRDISAGRTMRGIAGDTDTLRSKSLAAAKAVGVLAGGAALTGLTVTLKTGFRELQDYQGGLSQLRAGLKSTKGAANVSAKGMEALAQRIQSYSGQTDDSIVKTESLLLTFPKIRNEAGKTNDIFDQTTKLAADMAARLGTDASSQAIRLGKALQDPVRGMTALTRAGVVFDDQQRAQITRLVEHNRTLDAQKIILAEVNKEFGGSAKAFGQTLPGQIARTKRAYEEVSQELATDLLPYALKFTKWLRKDAIPALEDFGGWVKRHKTELEWFAGTIGGLAVGFKAFKGVRSVQSLFGKGPLARTGGGLLGSVASKANPVPVYVVNNLPGVRGKEPLPVGKAGGFFGKLFGVFDRFPKAVKVGGALAIGGELAQTTKKTLGGMAHGTSGAVGGLLSGLGKTATDFGSGSAFGDFGTLEKTLGGLVGLKRGADAAGQSEKKAAEAAKYNAQALSHLNKLLLVNPGLTNAASGAHDKLALAMREVVGQAKIEAAVLGHDLGRGLVAGIEAEIPHATVAGKILVQQTTKAMRYAADAHSPSRVTMALGKDIADGLVNGFINVKAFDKLAVETRHGLMQLSRETQRAVDYRSNLKSGLLGYASLSGMGSQTDLFGSPMTGNTHVYLRQRRNDLRTFRRLRERLVNLGASPALLAEYDQLGPDAIPEMRQEISSGRGGVRRDSRLERQIRHTASAISSTATSDRFGGEMERLLQRLPHRLAHELARELRHLDFNVRVDDVNKHQGKKVRTK